MGGIVASHHGSYGHFQGRRQPTNRNSTQQQFVRNAVGQLSAIWAAVLTDAQRASWNTYASNVSRTNRLGELVHNSGLSMYVRANVARSFVTDDRIDAGPSIFNLGSFTAPTFVDASVVIQELRIDVETGLASDPWANEVGSWLLFFVGRPQNPGIRRYRGSYRFSGAVQGDPVPPTSERRVPSPFPFVLGHRIFARAVVSYADGRYSSDSFSTVIAVA